MKTFKYICYVGLFVLLGIFVSFIIHGVVELSVVALLENDFETFHLGFSWESWFLIHDIGAMILPIAGGFFGFTTGKYWWHKIYEYETDKKR